MLRLRGIRGQQGITSQSARRQKLDLIVWSCWETECVVRPLIDRKQHVLIRPPGFLRLMSSWGFYRRALSLLESTSPASQSDGPPAPRNLDGTAFCLAWSPKSTVEVQDVHNLPSNDCTTYPYDTVQYRLDDLLGIIDDDHFGALMKFFQGDPFQAAKTYRLSFLEFLLALAFGKALFFFLKHPGSSAATGPPGSEHAA